MLQHVGHRERWTDPDPSTVESIDAVQRLGYRLMEVGLELGHPTSVLVDRPHGMGRPLMHRSYGSVEPRRQFALNYCDVG